MALAVAGKAVAASAISTIVRKSFDYLESYIKSKGMKSVKERLERTLPQVQVVFDAVDLERIRDQSEALDAWLWQFRDAAEEAEDVLDEVEYYRLEKKVKSRGNKVSVSLNKCKRILIQQFNTSFKVGTFKRMVDAMKKLDKVAVGVETFIVLVDRLDSRSLRNTCRETSSFVVDETIIGRDTERDQIVEWLIKQGDDNQHLENCNVSTFALVGIGGMGKTSLVQSVYLDQRVKQYFDQTIWVCVSNDFDVHTLTRKIIQETGGDGTDVTSLNRLQEILKGKLSSKKFLLVLDDVWNDETIADWEKLLAPLKFGQKGSKILMTTRMQSVIETVERALGVPSGSLKLQRLQENDIFKLFNKHAFFGVNPDNYLNLQGIGKQIVKRLSGSPLAAKVMGGLLRNSLDTVSWNRVLRENISNMEHGSDVIMNILRLSYHHLPSHLQACFRYCSLFKEDYKFGKDELVDLWMGSGLIQTSAGECQSPEDVGEYYLGILTRKSFLELRSWKSYESYGAYETESPKEHYVMHDLLHELARTVSKGECVNISNNNYGDIPETVRHLNIRMVSCSLTMDFSILKKLRTLIISFDNNVEEKEKWHVLKKIIEVATKLRALRVCIYSRLGTEIKLPIAFDNLLHLRYLSSSGGWSDAARFPCYLSRPHSWSDVRFPSSVYKLYHLQIIQTDKYLGESSQLSNLVNLRNLYYSGIHQTGSPARIGELTCLQNLRVSLKHKRISELKELKDLRYLYIDDTQNNDVEEAKLAKLAEKENLVQLSLSWSGGPSESGTEEEYLDNLQPHRNVTKLRIDRYSGSRSPFWMQNPMISNLTYVSISNCIRWQNLPPLGSLPSLEYLYLRGMYAVKKVDNSFYGFEKPLGFPSLKLLSISWFPALEEWVQTEGGNLFPQLKTLFIEGCKALRNVPALPSTLAHLTIEDVGLTSLPAMYHPSVTAVQPKSSLSKLEIFRCPNLATMEQENYFFGLEELHISHCESLSHLPMDRLWTLPYLKTFGLGSCPNLIAPQEDICLPSSVSDLTVASCGDYETCLLNSLCTLSSLTTLRLYNCVMITLPSAGFRSLERVRCLQIVKCRELAALDGIEKLTSLRDLIVTGCDKLEKHLDVPTQQVSRTSDLNQDTAACPSYLGKLEKLRISNPFVLQWEPLRRVNTVTNLTFDESGRCLPEEWLMKNRNHLKRIGVENASHLEFLPSIMASLTSLETLELKKAVLLQTLPELPASLEILQFLECHPVLERRCQKSRGRDWHKIAHIPNLRIVKDRPSSCTWYYYDGMLNYVYLSDT